MIQVRRWMPRVIVAAAVMATVTACGGAETDTPTVTSPGGVVASEVGDGTFEGRIETARDGTLAFDEVEVLAGEEAAAAREADGEVVDPGVDIPYIRDVDSGTVSAPVADDVTVRVIDCAGGGCELADWAWEDIVAGRDLPYGPPDTVFTITVRDGRVVELAEVYLP
jgi:hypothetical protein